MTKVKFVNDEYKYWTVEVPNVPVMGDVIFFDGERYVVVRVEWRVVESKLTSVTAFVAGPI